MTQNASHWYIDSQGSAPAALRAGFAWLLDQMQMSGSHSGLLAIPGKGDLEDAFEGVLSPTTLKELTKSNTARTKWGTLALMTEKIRRSSWSGSILAVYPTTQLLDSLDSLHGPSAVLVVPWLRDEVSPWIRTWSARELGSTEEPSERVFSNSTVRAALESLTRRVNMGTGLAHPSDRAAAIEMFRMLKRAGEHYDPDEVRAWLVSQLRWQPRHANAVAEIAGKILAGGRFHPTTSGGWATDAVERWRANAQSGLSSES